MHVQELCHNQLCEDMLYFQTQGVLGMQVAAILNQDYQLAILYMVKLF